MKKLLLLLAPLTLGLMVGCSYDDSAILDKITELEKEQDEMQAQIDAQQALLDALANNLTITAVTQNDNGYTITFSDGSSMTIKNGEQGEKGDKGDNGEKGEQGDSFIESIEVGEEDVTFTLADGTVIVIPLGSDSGDTSSEDNKIYYTTSDNTKLFPKTDASLYGAILISNTYKDGQGVLVFDDAITSIGNYAFQNCSSLTSLTIPDSVTEIGEAVFYGCSSLKEFKGKFASEDGRCLVIDGKLVAFATFGLTQYSIPDSVTSIGDYAFYDCTSLTSVTIGNSVTSIGGDAFKNCTGELILNCSCLGLYGGQFTKVVIGNGVTSIGSSAFSGCTSLTSITIPDSVTSIGEEAFYGCTGELIINSKVVETDYDKYSYPARYGWLNGANFTKLTIGNNVTSIGERAFLDCSLLTSITIPDSITSIGEGAFSGCTSLTSITIPDSVTLIGNYAFGGCSSLTSITIGNGVTEIGYEAFMGCTSLTSITIPDGVTEIGTSTFENCSSLTSVTIPDGVTSIGSDAFRDCSSLTSITIPDSVTEIGDWAFSRCSSLTYVYCKPTTRPSGGYGMFDNNALGRTIYVPTESVVAYKNAKYWKDYASRIEGYDFE